MTQVNCLSQKYESFLAVYQVFYLLATRKLTSGEKIIDDVLSYFEVEQMEN